MEITESNKRKREILGDLEFLESELQKKKICLDSKDLFCPITKQMYCNPVTTDDGFTYEKWAIDNLIKNNFPSPMTREPIHNYFENKLVENLINNFLNENSEFKKLQFDEKLYIDYSENKKECHKLLANKNFSKFCEYKDIL